MDIEKIRQLTEVGCKKVQDQIQLEADCAMTDIEVEMTKQAELGFSFLQWHASGDYKFALCGVVVHRLADQGFKVKRHLSSCTSLDISWKKDE